MARYQNSIWRPTDKYGYDPILNHTTGVVRVIIHSAEGYRSAMFAVLDGPREASWHFSDMRNGEVYQHVSTANIAWGAGSFEANDGSIHIELEGVTGQALTSAQYVSTIALLRWVFRGYGLGEPSRETNLREHNEFFATSCPSNRVPWTRLIEDLREGDMDMTTEELRDIIRQELKPVKDELVIVRGKVEVNFNQINRKSGVVLSGVISALRKLTLRLED